MGTTSGHGAWGGNGEDDFGNGIAVDNAGNVYTTGQFSGEANFDPDVLQSAGGTDAFVQKLDTNGNLLWVGKLATDQGDRGHAIAVDDAVNVYVTGEYAGSATLDFGATAGSLTAPGGGDIFVLKLSGPDLTPPSATTIIPATTGPTNATGVSFTVTFDEEVQNFDTEDDLEILHNGTVNSSATISGGPVVYTVEISGIGGDGSFTVAVSTASDVQDLAGNALGSSVVSAAVTVDNTAPVFSNVEAAPPKAQVGQTVVISFDASETIPGDPDVTVNGNPATAGAKAGADYSYEYTVQPTDPEGPATITISGLDHAGNAALLADTAALTITGPEAPAVPLAAWPLGLALTAAGAIGLRRRRK